MLNIPVLRWGSPYESLDTVDVLHFITGEPVARLSQAGGGLIRRDMRKAQRARDVLRQFSCEDLIERMNRAGQFYLEEELPLGDGTQTPDEFARAQSASTGLPEHMCRANMKKNHFVLSHMDEMLAALTRGLDLSILSRGHGVESRAVTVSYQAQSPVVGLVLPSNSPGVHTLWLPCIPLQIGLVQKPGSQEPWTAYRMQAAMMRAGIPPEAISIYPGSTEVGATILTTVARSMIFGGAETVARYQGDPRVQVHGPGFSKIVLGDDEVDDWEKYLDLMVESVSLNAGRSCINASGIWASRHTREIADALAERLGRIEVKPPDDPDAALAAFTVPGAAESIWKTIESGFTDEGAEHVTAAYGERLVQMERCGYLRPTVVHCVSPELPIAKSEYMFPFVSIVKCPQEKMLESMGPTLVCTALTSDEAFQQRLIDATQIDRLNLGAIPTTQIDWMQPHEGNLVDFLFRSRAFKTSQGHEAQA